MFGLIQANFAASRKPDGCDRSPSFFLNRRANDVFLRQPLHLRVKVFTHEVELMAIILFGRMKGRFGWRQGEYQPAVAGIERREPQHIAKEGAVRRCIFAVDDDMCTGNHDESSLAPANCPFDMR
jgi:hypothetical protein